VPTRSRRKPQPTEQSEPAKVGPSLQYSIACSGIQQIPGGGFVILSPFDTITRIGDAPQPISIMILDCWTSGVGHFSEYLTITDPNGTQVIQTSESQFWLPNSFHRHNVHHNLRLALLEPGMHVVKVFLDNQEVLNYKIKFDVRPAPSPLSVTP